MVRLIPGTGSLRVFEAAGRHLNFTRAAEELHVTPAAVSHQIKEFEEQLDIRLLERTSRSMRLTAAGEILHAAVTEALAGLTRAVGQMQRRRDSAALKVTASTSIAARWLVPRLDDFMKTMPGVDVRLDVSDRVREFARDEIDVAIRFGNGNYPGHRADRLFDNTIFPVCSPALLRTKKPLLHPRDLLQHRLIHVDWSAPGVMWPNWRMWMLAAGVTDYQETAGLRLDNSGLALQAAIDGQGVALGDSSLVSDDLAAGRLVQPFAVTIKGPQQFAYYVISPVATQNDPLVRSFRDWILDEAAKTPLVK
jgi:LysR family transcriptional regulator, glycine cleavage system transcriptional activator